MSSAVKASENQTKHRTKAEKATREEAERSVTPDRDGASALAKPPKGFSGAVKTYWDLIVSRLDGVLLLDELDREALGIYCQMLVRRDRMNRLCEKLLAGSVKGKLTEERLEAVDKLDSLTAKIATLERNILTYADKLGFTPQSRVRLAQKRAAVAVEDAAADYFGDAYG